MLTKIGLDLGYANITLSDISAGIYREPSIALVDKETRRIISVGTAAGSEDATPGSILVRPFKNGLLFDGKITRGVIESAISAVRPAEKIRCIIATPSSLLAKQEKEIFDMLEESGVSESFSVYRSVAALIGAGYSPDMSAISVNIGAKKTEVTVMYQGKVHSTVCDNVGGEDFDKAVKDYILAQGDVNISLSVAKAIKEHLGAVWSGRVTEPIDIEGTLSLTGNRVKMSVSDEDIVGVFEKPVHAVLKTVADTVKKIPFEMVEEIFRNGIILTGGGAELYGLDLMMNKVLGIPVTKPKDAIDSVAKGLARINSFIPARMRTNKKNITHQLVKYYATKQQQQDKKRD